MISLIHETQNKLWTEDTVETICFIGWLRLFPKKTL